MRVWRMIASARWEQCEGLYLKYGEVIPQVLFHVQYRCYYICILYVITSVFYTYNM